EGPPQPPAAPMPHHPHRRSLAAGADRMSTGRRAPGPQRAPIRPERVRRTEGGFAFIPNRFLHGGFFASLDHLERSLYLFLVLAGDRNGVSYYAYDKICATLET